MTSSWGQDPKLGDWLQGCSNGHDRRARRHASRLTDVCQRTHASARRPGTDRARPWTRVRSSARSREAEIDLARARIGPARGDDLGPGVELDALGAVHVEVAEQAVLPATEAVVGDRHRDRDVDPDHPRVDLELELPGGPAVACEDRGPVAVR